MTVKELDAELKKLVERVGIAETKLEVAIRYVNELRNAQPVAKHTETTQESITKEVKEEKFEYPVPQEYREIVDTLLNKDFKIWVDYKDGNTDFNLVVPDKYSTINPEARKVMGGIDRRRKIIPPFEGANGVKAYVENVWKSFNPSFQAMIVSDRSR